RPYLFSLTLSSYYTTLHPLLHSFPTRRSSDLTVPAFTSRETWSRAFTPGKVFVMSTILSRTSFGIVRSSFYIGRGMSSGSENGKQPSLKKDGIRFRKWGSCRRNDSCPDITSNAYSSV